MKKIIAIAASVAALLSCSKESNVNSSYFEKGQTVTLSVTAGVPSTKVTSALNADGTTVDFTWAEGDKILVTVDTQTAEFTLASGAGSASATFTGTMPAAGSSFDVQYPVTDPTITSQTYSTTEALPHDAMKFAATGCTTSSPFSLSAQSTALRLNLYATSQTISKIVVTNTSSSESPKPSYTLNISGGKTLSTDSANPTPFFIIVPAGSYAFTAEVFDNSATPVSVCTFVKSAEATFEAGKVLNMPAKEVKQTLSGCSLDSMTSSDTAW